MKRLDSSLLSIDEVKELIQQPVAICDGGVYGVAESTIANVFAQNDIIFNTEMNLYERSCIHLSCYRTIAFGTHYSVSSSPKLRKIMDFDKNNLNVIIVLTSQAFEVIRNNIAAKYIICIAFNSSICVFFNPLIADHF